MSDLATPVVPRWLKVLSVLVGLFLVLLFFLQYMARTTEEKYSYLTVQHLRRDRDWALHSDVPRAATILGYVREGTNTKQRPGAPLDQMCSIERSNVMVEIIAYLRTKTGEDLGERPE